VAAASATNTGPQSMMQEQGTGCHDSGGLGAGAGGGQEPSAAAESLGTDHWPAFERQILRVSMKLRWGMDGWTCSRAMKKTLAVWEKAAMILRTIIHQLVDLLL
jgi:hypothetical protein